MSIVRELESLLSRERSLLLEGDFSKLEKLVEHKLWLEQRLAEEKPNLPVERLDALRQEAAQNEELLAAAQRGLKTAMTQLSKLADGDAQKTYSAEGERVSLARKPSAVAQKI